MAFLFIIRYGLADVRGVIDILIILITSFRQNDGYRDVILRLILSLEEPSRTAVVSGIGSTDAFGNGVHEFK